ncbi:MAG: response regulator transcription factor [Candidatus Limnocylindrales bacterium]
MEAVAAIRLGLVDDHPAIEAAIEAAARAAVPAITLSHAARTADEGIALATLTAAERPHVVLSDLQLGGGLEGIRVIEALAAAGIRAIAFTSFDRASLMRAVFEAGGVGFVSKASEMDDVIAAVRTVAAGGTAFTVEAIGAARSAPRAPSERERAVLRGIVSGATSDEVGVRLGISGRTVESHVRRLFDRYGVVSRTELAVLADREGWIVGEP